MAGGELKGPKAHNAIKTQMRFVDRVVQHRWGHTGAGAAPKLHGQKPPVWGVTLSRDAIAAVKGLCDGQAASSHGARHAAAAFDKHGEAFRNAVFVKSNGRTDPPVSRIGYAPPGAEAGQVPTHGGAESPHGAGAEPAAAASGPAACPPTQFAFACGTRLATVTTQGKGDTIESALKRAFPGGGDIRIDHVQDAVIECMDVAVGSMTIEASAFGQRPLSFYEYPVFPNKVFTLRMKDEHNDDAGARGAAAKGTSGT